MHALFEITSLIFSSWTEGRILKPLKVVVEQEAVGSSMPTLLKARDCSRFMAVMVEPQQVEVEAEV